MYRGVILGLASVFIGLLFTGCSKSLNKDFTLQATAYDGRVKVFGADVKGSLESLRKKMGTSPNASVALGRTLSVAAMLASEQNKGESTIVEVDCNGPIGGVAVTVTAGGKVVGSVKNANVELDLNDEGKFSESKTIGSGAIIVSKVSDKGVLSKKSSPIVSGEMGDDFSNYLAKAENTPAAVIVGEQIDIDNSIMVSGGIIVEIVGKLSDEELVELEDKVDQMEPISSQLMRKESIQTIIEKLMGPIVVIEKKDIFI
ncbi:Hsp33 family molecular chaperone HslO [Cohnella ginsengisoli]|uniref:Hsp33 family molecular chaperone HslO n=1 Tax=Cohnella ginsengisoli TaxID=425004 RepID=A0A9X4QMD8_9BACL|nr:Hsp33 family molecular chaperone HslO [Cohnella ginsengisoli]MDG0791122.1 Hsp33 family molecular chaperone HslO [Cohnella ginsengisoli]